ncbi:MAG: LysM peptidoglycan-binding domain-containing protein [Deltaproteobacteria bacterium]|nr:LysM peptidoglycan-binding domain-containing protein [Candidatus Anaeroferrophillus wilburensis]MBN2890135.1 LysM peptidoglycan-binding domain-containing protein [Deltaproteobacteria bacterium]
MKRTAMLLFSVFLLMLLFLGVGTAKADDALDGVVTQALKSGKSEVYVIKKGDTLWDLSERFYLTPWQWPTLWGANPYILDPHWIYPGNKLNVFPRPGKEKAAKPAADSAASAAPQPSPAEEGTVSIPQKNNFCPILFAAMADDFPQVKGGEGMNDLLIIGDRFFFDDPSNSFNSGELVKVIHYVDEISHRGKPYHLYQEVAVARIRGAREKYAWQGELLAGKAQVVPGDRLIPFQTYPASIKIQPGQTTVAATVLAIDKGRRLADSGSFIVIDQGESGGVKIGEVYAAYDRENAFWRNPTTKVYGDKYADIIVTRVFPDYAVALVANLNLPFTAGVVLQGEKADFPFRLAH